MEPLRRTCTQVSLSALKANIQAARAFLPPRVRLMVVAKADGYGHGLEEVGSAAQRAGADFLGVALAEEGITLRQSGVTLPILCFGALNQAGFDASVKWDLTATVADAAGALQGWLDCRA